MYGNVGNRIKGLVKTIVYIFWAIIALLAIILMARVDDITYDYHFGVILLILLGAGICGFLVWISGMAFYAFGEIAARLISIDEKLPKPEKEEAKPFYRSSAEPEQPNGPSVAEKISNRVQAGAASFAEKLYDRTHTDAAPKAAPEKTVPPSKPTADKWKCYQCGTSNTMERTYCSQCLSSRDWSINKSNAKK